MKVNRRQWAALVAGTAAATQTPVAAQPAPPEDVNKTVRDVLRSNIDQLAKVKLPMATEPSFIFRPSS
jgi:hypothetical protein